jgi:DNA uptake protein ComE-like DNA-binding protein
MKRTVTVVACVTLLACGPEAGERVDETPAAAATGDVAVEAKLIDPNSATREQVLSTPGMTEGAGEALLSGRPYDDMLEVDRVLAQHLNEQQRDSVYAQLWRPLDLNTATGDEILLIPGVGARMRHEFEEYRPYTSIAQFRREIGKYVDDDEVARLEQYVTIR